MLERINLIKTVGLLHNATANQFSLKKINLIYANNGRGKSTLASIFRSYAENDPQLISERKTFGKNEEQEINFQFSKGKRVNFLNGRWDKTHTDMYVFDLDFVERNVYTGGDVTPAQRKNFLKFAIGKLAVQSQKNYDNAHADYILKESLMNTHLNKLSGYHSGMSVAAYIKIKKDPLIDDKISLLEDKINSTRNIIAIKSKPVVKPLKLPDINIDDFIKTLSTTVDNIDIEAEKKVRAHIDKCSHKNIESWISNGVGFIDKDECPMCGQNTNHLDLFSSYRSYFNKEYRDLNNKINKLTFDISLKLNDSLIDTIIMQSSEAVSISDSWQEHIKLDLKKIRRSTIQDSLTVLRDIFLERSSLKKQYPLDNVFSLGLREECLAYKSVINSEIEKYNSIIAEKNKLIIDFKNNLENENIDELVVIKNQLIIQKNRYSANVINLIDSYTQAKTEKLKADTTRSTLKLALETEKLLILQKHEAMINNLLSSFGANFRIKEAKINYAGNGEAKSEYILSMIGKDISINAKTSTFGTSLSEGDRRTLAFAFFMAVVLSDPDIANKIIIIDDPMCSLDANRKFNTIRELIKLHRLSKQLIILAHDIYFIREIRDLLVKTKDVANCSTLELCHVAGGYSNFRAIDVDVECESPYFKNHRTLNSYINNNTPEKSLVAPCIRKMLEGYLHRRFPGEVKRNCMFGEVVKQIRDAPTSSPLYYAKNIVDELNEINSYAGRFHHDTNPDFVNEVINESELARYCNRALIVTYQG